jgi:hypothetical protein
MHELDLGTNASVSIKAAFACPEDYGAVVMYIADIPAEIRPKVACHSANPEAHKKFASILEAVGDRLYLTKELEKENV